VFHRFFFVFSQVFGGLADVLHLHARAALNDVLAKTVSLKESKL
jgi:hypothetical protein